MFYAYIFLGAGILILSILFRLAAVFRLTIPLLYALVVPTLLSDWYYAHYTLANVIWYILLAVRLQQRRAGRGSHEPRADAAPTHSARKTKNGIMPSNPPRRRSPPLPKMHKDTFG